MAENFNYVVKLASYINRSQYTLTEQSPYKTILGSENEREKIKVQKMTTVLHFVVQ